MSRPHYVDMETVSGDAHTTGSEDGVYTRTDKSSSSSVMKRPRILSTIGSATSANNGQSSETAERDEAHEEGDSKSSVHNRPEFVQRNKRLFGALMGHLGTAKRKLEEDSSTIDKQTSRQNAVAHKNSVENRRLQQLQREATDAEKSKEKSLRRIFQLRQQKVDIATALLAWKGKYIASIKEVLMTESVPRICWLPSAHNERTKKMLENRNEELLEETSRRDQADTALIEHIDAELECLQSQVTVNSLPAEESLEAIGLDSVDNSASAAVSTDAGAGSALSGSELTEYMLRIRNRRNLALKADAIDQNDPNNQKVRANWSLDDGADGNGNGFNTRSMQNYSQQDTSNADKHGGRNYTESSSRDRSRNTAPRSSSHRGKGGGEATSATSQDREEGEDGEENESSSTDHSNQDSHPANKRKESSYSSRKGDMPAVSDAVDDDSAPPESNEGADEGEVEEEEDEAEQLLAALGGR